MDQSDTRLLLQIEREIADCWERLDACQEELLKARFEGCDASEKQFDLDRLQSHRIELEQRRACLTARWAAANGGAARSLDGRSGTT